ncbi:MAG: hypothetical protein CL418_07570 [Acidimicrobiaceae bacterium]|nr:hypothetical protein [Acidimicrobiaceae bacterium]
MVVAEDAPEATVVVVVESEDAPEASVVVVVESEDAPEASVVVVVCCGTDASTDTSVSMSIRSSRNWMISALSCSISSSLVWRRPQPVAPRARIATRAVAVTMCRRITAVFQIGGRKW